MGNKKRTQKNNNDPINKKSSKADLTCSIIHHCPLMLSLLWVSLLCFCRKCVHHIFKNRICFKHKEPRLFACDCCTGRSWRAPRSCTPPVPDDGVTDSPFPPLGEALLPCSSPLTKVVFMALSWFPLEAVAGLMQTFV